MAEDAMHISGRPQSWRTVDKEIGDWVRSILKGLGDLLHEDLVGIYLHGSLAMGCYYAPKSDVDL